MQRLYCFIYCMQHPYCLYIVCNAPAVLNYHLNLKRNTSCIAVMFSQLQHGFVVFLIQPFYLDAPS